MSHVVEFVPILLLAASPKLWKGIQIQIGFVWVMVNSVCCPKLCSSFSDSEMMKKHTHFAIDAHGVWKVDAFILLAFLDNQIHVSRFFQTMNLDCEQEFEWHNVLLYCLKLFRNHYRFRCRLLFNHRPAIASGRNIKKGKYPLKIRHKTKSKCRFTKIHMFTGENGLNLHLFRFSALHLHCIQSNVIHLYFIIGEPFEMLVVPLKWTEMEIF